MLLLRSNKCLCTPPPSSLLNSGAQFFFEVFALQQRDLPFANSIDASLSPWVAAPVSREWRAICLAEWCRKLWTQVSIDEDFVTRLLENDTSPVARERRGRRLQPKELELEDRSKTQLRYAGGLPLAITLDLDDIRAQELIMGIVWPYRSTWRQFRAEESRTLPFEEAGNWNRVFERYCDAQDGSTDVHFPNLASVWFSYSSRRGIDPELATFTSIPQCALELFQPPCVPVLTEVHLHANLALPDPDEHCERLPWSQLHSITLEGVPSAYLCILFYRIAPQYAN